MGAMLQHTFDRSMDDVIMFVGTALVRSGG